VIIIRYSVVIEKGEKNYSAYLPDVLGCIAAGLTPEITIKRLAEALEMHLGGLREGWPADSRTKYRS
jgi:predicted RNase H-like HicB family nuclease